MNGCTHRLDIAIAIQNQGSHKRRLGMIDDLAEPTKAAVLAWLQADAERAIGCQAKAAASRYGGKVKARG